MVEIIQSILKRLLLDGDISEEEALSDMAEFVESGEEMLSIVRFAEENRVPKRKIIILLKKMRVSEHDIIVAYTNYYKVTGLYEVTFHQRPLGFCCIIGNKGKDAIVTRIVDDNASDLIKPGSKLYEINGKRIDGMKYKKILKLVASQPTPFYIVCHKEDPMSHKVLFAHQCKRITHWWWIETGMNHGPFHLEEEWMVDTMEAFMETILGLQGR